MPFLLMGEGEEAWSWSRTIIQGGLALFFYSATILVLYHFVVLLIKTGFGVELPNLFYRLGLVLT